MNASSLNVTGNVFLQRLQTFFLLFYHDFTFFTFVSTLLCQRFLHTMRLSDELLIARCVSYSCIIKHVYDAYVRLRNNA